MCGAEKRLSCSHRSLRQISERFDLLCYGISLTDTVLFVMNFPGPRKPSEAEKVQWFNVNERFVADCTRDRLGGYSEALRGGFNIGPMKAKPSLNPRTGILARRRIT